MAPKNRAEYQELLAKEFLNCLSEKGLKWKRGWDTVNMAPRNAVTGGYYHGVNQFYLGLLAMTRGYTDPRWATMAQIKDKNETCHPGERWWIKKGSKAVYVEYWYPWDAEKHESLSWQAYRQLTPEEQARYDLRVRYTPVFHASMIDGIAPIQTVKREGQRLDDLVARLSNSMGVELLFDGGGSAFYRPSEDKVHLPAPEAFRSEYELNATALHELAHATGHESRLNRPQGARFGTPEYAYEELVAEISSCFFGVDLDIEQTPQHIENHKAYVQNWIKAITEKPETLIAAVRDAQKAAGYMEYHAGLTREQEAALDSRAGPASSQQATASKRTVQAQEPRPWSPVTRGGKLHFTDEQYKIAREASALEYARQQGYDLVREGSRYHLREHDSMIFLPNGQWHWNSRTLHGGAIEFITQYEGKTLPEAVLTLNGIDYNSPELSPPAPAARYAPSPEALEAAAEKPQFVLPPRAEAMNRTFAYLCGVRGLDYDLVRQLVRDHRIYESVYRRPDGSQLHNTVFVGLDRQGVPRSASLRGCGQASSFKMEQPGSDKGWPFLIPGRADSDTLYIFEAAIDAASHATIQKLAGLDWQAGHRVALGGNPNPEALPNVLGAYPGIKRVCLCTDNDDAGRAIAAKLTTQLRDELHISDSSMFREPVPVGKDWNEYLQTWRAIVDNHQSLPTTNFVGRDSGEVRGRIHFLNPDGSVNETYGYTDPAVFHEDANLFLAHSQPCVVETAAQLEELRRLTERRAARQKQDQQRAKAEEALERVRADGEPDADKEVSRERRGSEFVLPPRAEAMDHVLSYLCGICGLDYDLVQQLVQEQQIYESITHRPDGSELPSVVFVGLDRLGTPSSATLQDCSQTSLFTMEQPGSDENWPFIISGQRDTYDSQDLYIFGSVIDAISHATVWKLAGLNWQSCRRAVLDENFSEQALTNALKTYPPTKMVYLCTGSDDTGMAIERRLRLFLCDESYYSGRRDVCTMRAPIGKNWNEYLQVWRSTVANHQNLSTTEFPYGELGEVRGRIHYLAPDGSVEKTCAYTDLEHVKSVAPNLILNVKPCVVETAAQLEELRRLTERRAARQRQDQQRAKAEEDLDRVRADGEPDADKEVSRERRGFRDNAPDESRADMSVQLASAAEEAEQRNQQRQAQAQSSVRER